MKIVVKSADNTRAKGLKVYMDTFKPAYAIKLSVKNFSFENDKKSNPWILFVSFPLYFIWMPMVVEKADYKS